ncbi:hypothetical protein SASPL_133213 [Salvia splendens]|uniref:GOLD domain-containing protein n=1 Tax=Salvia splendens TaxID=180675 RepID=A0A8X8X2A1_SALSN|nr:hypothetical protein SASPL_133213 [Salvia splendens]
MMWIRRVDLRMERGGNVMLVLAAIVLILRRVESIRFDLETGHSKCIAEDIRINSMTVGKYQVVNNNEGLPLPDAHKITIRVTSAYGNNYHYAENIAWGHFAFQAADDGDYMACFYAAETKPSSFMTVDFDWKSGVAASDWTRVAKKGSLLVSALTLSLTSYSLYLMDLHLQAMELELKNMYDTVQFIQDEIYYLRERPAALAPEVILSKEEAYLNSFLVWGRGMFFSFNLQRYSSLDRKKLS